MAAKTPFLIPLKVEDCDDSDLLDIVFHSDPGSSFSESHYAILHRSKPPVFLRVTDNREVPIPVRGPASSVAFRPVAATAINHERAPEVAVAYGRNSTFVEIFDLSLGEPIASLPSPRTLSVAYNQQGTVLALGTAAGAVRIYDIGPNGQRKERFCVSGARSGVVRMAFNSRGETLFLLTARGEPYILDLTGKPMLQPYALEGLAFDGAFECWAHACHSLLPVVAYAGSREYGGERCRVTVVDFDTEDSISFLTSNRTYVRRLQFVGESGLLVFGDAGVELWGLDPLKQTKLSADGQVLEVAYNGVTFAGNVYAIGV